MEVKLTVAGKRIHFVLSMGQLLTVKDSNATHAITRGHLNPTGDSGLQSPIGRNDHFSLNRVDGRFEKVRLTFYLSLTGILSCYLPRSPGLA